ncbi:MAG: alpha/beta hydrolase [Gammaproteobacteria bacterium]|nr:alpha/beta hydrolase [Gammaproteobacteria bacterium]
MKAILFKSAAPLALALAVAGCGAMTAGGDDAGAGPAHRFGSIDFQPCTLDGGAARSTIEARCGTLEVAEDPAAPGGRRIGLNIAWLPATSAAGATGDPVFFLAGGPGQAATTLAWHINAALGQVRRQRDLILVDQRGTGGSNPLDCRTADGEPMPLDPEMMLSAETMLPYVRACRASVEQRADPRLYTTGHAIADLEAVRQALGVEQVNLVGGSYGTRVAQQYADAFPERVRTMVIDGVAPNDVVVGGEFDRTFERTLRLQSEYCSADEQCRERFDGDLRERMRALMAQLQAAPVEVEFHHPLTHELQRDTVTADTVTGLAFFFSYAPHTISMLPLLLDEAAHGRYGPLMSLTAFGNEQMMNMVNRGMQWSVLCAEDAPRHVPDPDADTILGPDAARMLFAACEAWPAGTPRAGHAEPLESDVPVLLLSGELDPVTPPEYAERVLAGLPNGRHLVLDGQSHGTLVVGCMPRLVARFIESADAGALDAACLDDVRPVPPFTSFNGWEP